MHKLAFLSCIGLGVVRSTLVPIWIVDMVYLCHQFTRRLFAITDKKAFGRDQQVGLTQPLQRR